MTITNNKPQKTNSRPGYSVNECNLRMKCPNCDKRRSGRCNHSSILNLKGNTK
jgi:hypothetical protein